MLFHVRRRLVLYHRVFQRRLALQVLDALPYRCAFIGNLQPVNFRPTLEQLVSLVHSYLCLFGNFTTFSVDFRNFLAVGGLKPDFEIFVLCPAGSFLVIGRIFVKPFLSFLCFYWCVRSFHHSWTFVHRMSSAQTRVVYDFNKLRLLPWYFSIHDATHTAEVSIRPGTFPEKHGRILSLNLKVNFIRFLCGTARH